MHNYLKNSKFVQKDSTQFCFKATAVQILVPRYTSSSSNFHLHTTSYFYTILISRWPTPVSSKTASNNYGLNVDVSISARKKNKSHKERRESPLMERKHLETKNNETQHRRGWIGFRSWVLPITVTFVPSNVARRKMEEPERGGNLLEVER